VFGSYEIPKTGKVIDFVKMCFLCYPQKRNLSHLIVSNRTAMGSCSACDYILCLRFTGNDDDDDDDDDD